MEAVRGRPSLGGWRQGRGDIMRLSLELRLGVPHMRRLRGCIRSKLDTASTVASQQLLQPCENSGVGEGGMQRTGSHRLESGLE